MSFLLFFVFHTLIGIALIYYYGKLPKAISTFFMVFFAFSILYWGSVVLSFMQL
ncbi:Uncharacterised protein [Sporosarcina pasteurii]|uniref:Uncharacterized protein n=1 Tax=Sporosarcina pasteurii TaxID=1474 RepID=A0A380BJT5_SPOPA|nr:Uncharacterised protein [Sporosarcina pasteurii]